ncbi:MAG: phage portal protein [Rhodocyclaceae bacterium]|nr:phage portal protein [Rhodocyclaceae bacterium]
MSQKGSVVLSNWLAGREGAVERAGFLASGQKPLTAEELVKMYAPDSYAGKSVSERGAMAVSAVYACVALIAGAISTLPAKIYERTENGRKRVDHPLWWLLNERASAAFSSAALYEYALWSMLHSGDAFIEIVRVNQFTSAVDSLRPIHPDRVRVETLADGSLGYYVTPKTGGTYFLTSDDMIHVPSLGFDGERGMSVVRYAAKQSIGTAIAQDEFSGRFFSNGARPDFVLKHPAKLSKDQIELLRSSWSKSQQGTGKSHLPAILTEGLDIKEVSMSADDAQLIQSRGFQVEDICRFFGVPPHMIGHTDKSSSWGSGVENMGRGFSKFTLSRHLVKIEQELNSKFWPNREKYFVEFDLAGLERGDLKSENEALRIALGRAGEPAWMTVNEVRKIKNLEPLDGDEFNKPAAAAPAPAPKTAPA